MPGGWELVADVGYHKGKPGPGVWWEPVDHVVGPCGDKDVVGCIGSLLVEEV